MNNKIVYGILIATIFVVGGFAFLAGRMGAKKDSVDTTAQVDGVSITDRVSGSKGNRLVLIEYGDYQCPSCGAYFPVLEKLKNDFSDLKLVFRNFPLVTIHDKAFDAALAVEAAGEQGKYWQMHDLVFKNQPDWVNDANYKKLFESYASQAGINIDMWKTDMAGTKVLEKVQRDITSGEKAKITSTPTFFLNGKKLELPGSYEKFKEVLKSEFDSLPSPTIGKELVHKHFDFALYVKGKRLDLSDDKYMEKNEDIHMHDKNDKVVHIHADGVTLGEFVDSLSLNTVTLGQWWLNGRIVTYDWKTYQPQDLDRIVLAFEGKVTPIMTSSVTDIACIYSEKCPERGKPPTEECVGGLNTPCE